MFNRIDQILNTCTGVRRLAGLDLVLGAALETQFVGTGCLSSSHSSKV
jgi:hypothetical protein